MTVLFSRIKRYGVGLSRRTARGQRGRTEPRGGPGPAGTGPESAEPRPAGISTVGEADRFLRETCLPKMNRRSIRVPALKEDERTASKNEPPQRSLERKQVTFLLNVDTLNSVA